MEASLNGRLLQVLEDIATTEERIVDISERLENAETMQQTKQGIYAFLKHFNAVFDAMEDEDKRAFLKSFIDSIEVYPKKRNGQLIKMIHFRFPMATKEGKEYSSVFFDDGSGSDFPTLTDDCLHIHIGIEQLSAADPGAGGAVQLCLRTGGEIDPKIFDAVFVTAGVGNFSSVDGHGLLNIVGIAAQGIRVFV